MLAALTMAVVMYRAGGPDDDPVLRPALVTRDWGGGCLNLQVALDGSNDDRLGQLDGEVTRARHVVWCTSVAEGDGVGQWRHVPAGGEADGRIGELLARIELLEARLAELASVAGRIELLEARVAELGSPSNEAPPAPGGA